MTNDVNTATQHSPTFIAQQQQIMRGLRRIKGLSGPSIIPLLESCGGLKLSDLHDDEYSEITTRMAQVNALLKNYQIDEVHPDYSCLSKSDAIRIMAHIVSAFDW